MIRRVITPAPLLLLLLTQCTEPNPELETGGPTNTSSGDSSSTSSASTTLSTSTSVDDDSSTSASDTNASETSVEDGDCPTGTHECLPPAPRGWFGPVAVSRDANDTRSSSCAAPFDAADATIAYSSLHAPTAQCSCECDPIDPSCSNVSLEVDDAPGCASSEGFGSVDVDAACRTLPPSAIGYLQAGVSEVDQGACFPDASSETPTARFEARATLCSAAVAQAPESCGDEQVCAPLPVDPFEPSACIWATGDVECPSALGYDARELLHQDFDDTRGCSQCTCGEIGGNCSGTVELWSGDDCDGTMLGELSFGGSCEAVASEVGSVRVSDYEPAAPCGAPSGGAPAGQATPTDPITLCCR